MDTSELQLTKFRAYAEVWHGRTRNGKGGRLFNCETFYEIELKETQLTTTTRINEERNMVKHSTHIKRNREHVFIVNRCSISQQPVQLSAHQQTEGRY